MCYRKYDELGYGILRHDLDEENDIVVNVAEDDPLLETKSQKSRQSSKSGKSGKSRKSSKSKKNMFKSNKSSKSGKTEVN